MVARRYQMPNVPGSNPGKSSDVPAPDCFGAGQQLTKDFKKSAGSSFDRVCFTLVTARSLMKVVENIVNSRERATFSDYG